MSASVTAKKKIGRYYLGERIGSGASGGVYVAWAENSDGVLNRYAIKIHPLQNDLDRDALEGFKREAAILTRLTHNNFTKFHEFGSLYDCRYIVMEYVDGITLKQLIEGATSRDFKIEPQHILYIIASIANALNYLTQVTDIETNETKAILHGDLTPDNIMVNTNGELKIIDFGVSQILTQAGRESREHDHGKVRYISPKRARGAVSDWHEDLFSLGIIGYELLSTKRLYEDFNMSKVALLLENHEYINKVFGSLKVAPEIKHILKKMVAANPTESGYATIDEFNREIQVLFSKTGPGYISRDMAGFIAKNFSMTLKEKRALGQVALDNLRQIRPNALAPLSLVDDHRVAKIKIQKPSDDSGPIIKNFFLILLFIILAFSGWRISTVAPDLLSVATTANPSQLFKYLAYEIFRRPLVDISAAYLTLDPLTTALPTGDEAAQYLLIKTVPPGASIEIDALDQKIKSPIYIKLSAKRPSLVSVIFSDGEKFTHLVPIGETVLNIKHSSP
jgi:serine/threonine protein kinase